MHVAEHPRVRLPLGQPPPVGAKGFGGLHEDALQDVLGIERGEHGDVDHARRPAQVVCDLLPLEPVADRGGDVHPEEQHVVGMRNVSRDRQI